MSKVSTRPQEAATPVADPHSIRHPQGVDGRPIRPVPQGAKDACNLLSPSLITLRIRSHERHFACDVGSTVASAGFTAGKHFIRPELVCRDTGDTVAVVQWDGFRAAMGECEEIMVCCDPENCAIAPWAGGLLVRAASRLAEQANGFIADGTGRKLSSEELQAVGEHIDDAIERRAAAALPKGIKIDANTVRFPGALSFQYYDQVRIPGRRRKEMLSCHFPAHKTTLFEGRVEGMKRASELISFVNNHRVRSPGLEKMLQEIFAGGQWNDQLGTRAGGYIAAAFVEIVEQVFRVGCRHVRSEWIQEQIQFYERQAKLEAEDREAQRAKKVSRKRGAA